MKSEEYIEGNRKVQLAFAFLLVIAAVLFIFIQSVISEALTTIQILTSDNPALAAKMAGRLLLWLVATSGVIAVVIAIYLLSLARKIALEHSYPPSGYPVAMRTKVRRGEECKSVIRSFVFLAIVLFAQPILGLSIWYWVTGGYW